MDDVERRMILTGAREGYSGRLGNFTVENGVINLRGNDGDVLAWTHYIGVMWQGYPEGDPRIKAAKEAIHGKRGVHKAPFGDGDGSSPVSGGGQPDGQGAGAEAAAVGSGSASGAPGAAGVLPDGNGQPQKLKEPVAIVNDKLKRAVMTLDPANNEHWTTDRKPSLTAVAALYGQSGITRADVEAVAKGYRRPAPKK